MLYLIGGVPRAGKTRLATRILRERGVNFVPTDALAMTLQIAAPELGVSLATPALERETRARPFVHALADALRLIVPSVTIEGELLEPEQIESFGADTRACFLLSRHVSADDLATETGTWISETPRHALPGFAQHFRERSIELEARCRSANVVTFDTGIDGQHDAAFSYLVSAGE